MKSLISIGQNRIILRDVTSPKWCRETWMSSYEYLIVNAPEAWEGIMVREGVEAFFQPASVEILKSIKEKAACLAFMESQRLEAADLFHLSPEKSERVIEYSEHCRVLDPAHLPCSSGYVAWSRPVARTEAGNPVCAAHWGPTEGGDGVWVALWAAFEGRQRDFLEVLGWNGYECEQQLPYGATAAEYGQAGRGIPTAALRALFNTWDVLIEKRESLKEVKADVPQAKVMRQLGLKPRPVYYLR